MAVSNGNNSVASASRKRRKEKQLSVTGSNSDGEKTCAPPRFGGAYAPAFFQRYGKRGTEASIELAGNNIGANRGKSQF